MVERARGVEPFEVEVYDWLLHKSVKRPIPDHETLELADPGDAVEAEEVRIAARASPNYLFTWLSNCALIRAGEPPRLAPLAGSEVGAISTAPFSTEPVDPRYLYVLLHALGCRKLAFLLLGTRPIDGEEETLYDTVVADVPSPRGGTGLPSGSARCAWCSSTLCPLAITCSATYLRRRGRGIPSRAAPSASTRS
jgi:hypothetical protein